MSEFQTLLVLSGMGVPNYSARGVVQTIQPIQQAGNLVRDINGELVDLSDNEFQKFASNISCNGDVSAPALNGIWPGSLIIIDCVFEFGYTSGSPIRSVVSGSTRTDGNGTTFYRPQLQMMVTNYQQSFDEWECTYNWSMDLEEV